MRRTTRALLALALFCLAASACARPEAEPEKLNFGVFGDVRIYRAPDSEPGRAVLLLSDGAWDARMDTAARAMADMDATVVGIDTARLLGPLRAPSGGCFYQSWEFEGLSKIVQKTLGYTGYHQPVLAGFGEGAAVAYATFAQAPKDIFAGAVTLGFSPRLGIQKPFCTANGYRYDNATSPETGIVMHPVEHPHGLLVLVQAEKDPRFSPAEANAFASRIARARVSVLAGADQARPEADTWRAAFREALDSVAPATRAAKPQAAKSVDDLPLVEAPAATPGKTLAVIVTGDGGWAGIDQQIGNILAAHGVSVVGFNSLKYFWNARTPEEMAHDLELTLTHYAAKWGAERYIVVGYSIGADVLPFMTGRMSEAAKARLALVAMLGPGTHADFEFHLSNWLTTENVPQGAPMIPEMEKLSKTPVLLVCGDEEEGTLCQNYEAPNVTPMVVPGGHHFNKEYDHIALAILRGAGIPTRP
ncbi:Type IV secretory pathway, VirJ component [Humidesulfovibrio mexicanus]|uniref:Type IV secretory pathway, VirJ component n=1 Tax=Humidesulfovibrio mexicanus TaxID=147047 RepID=A0A239ABS9_9BACT|nr:AcvB/VirJ family lysyl-phosphatidylglycerol hydrolase [Humidesulfovibrio mexicanus]SNR92791.1 Type IV secretory pathway, VirJ component [Humidesulfovibrio mexicanus]